MARCPFQPHGLSVSYVLVGRSFPGMPSRILPLVLSLQPLPVPVDHQQRWRGPCRAGPRRACRVSRSISPGQPRCDFAPLHPGAHFGGGGGSGGALADQHRRVHLDSGGLASVCGLGWLGWGWAPFSLLDGQLGRVRGQGSTENLPCVQHLEIPIPVSEAAGGGLLQKPTGRLFSEGEANYVLGLSITFCLRSHFLRSGFLYAWATAVRRIPSCALPLLPSDCR